MSSLSLASLTRSGVNRLTRPICTPHKTVISFRVQVKSYCWRVAGFRFSPTSSSFPHIQAVSGGTPGLFNSLSSASVGKPFGNCFSTISIFAVDCARRDRVPWYEIIVSQRTTDDSCRRNTESKQNISEIHSAIILQWWVSNQGAPGSAKLPRD